MKSVRPVRLVVYVLGICLLANMGEASARAPKPAAKPRPPKAARPPKPPKRPKPQVQKRQAKPRAQVKPQQRKVPEPQLVSNRQLAQGLHVLQSVKKTLLAADHDYRGHRAGAVTDIGKAEKNLSEASTSST